MVDDSDMITTRYHYFYIHNVFANFYKDVLDYFTTYLYPRFEWKVIGTYDKAVEYISKTDQYDRETDKPNLPALILNPSGEFNIAQDAGGRQLWRFPNLAPGFIKRLFDPIYQDQNIIVHVGFSRFRGEIELIMLLNSFYEFCDLRVFLLQIFGGVDRVIEPTYFSSFIILPEELINFRYHNEYTHVTYTLDWDTAGASERLVKTTNQTELVVPATIRPQLKLTNISDGSSRYGGTDKVADWRLTATVEFEIEMPSFLILESDYLLEKINFEIRYGSCYSSYNRHKAPVNRQLFTKQWSWGLDETSNSELLLDSTSVIDFTGEYVFKTRYYHVITESEAASTTNVRISLPEQITDKKSLIVESRWGEMQYGDHYRITKNGNAIYIQVDNVDLEKDMVIQLYVYEQVSTLL